MSEYSFLRDSELLLGASGMDACVPFLWVFNVPGAVVASLGGLGKTAERIAAAHLRTAFIF
jgi:hypothetical protein